MGRTSRQIQYATTEDGESIAFWSMGEGSPLILVHNWSISHLEKEWSVPSLASTYEELARRYRLVRLDPRGIGLSGHRDVLSEGAEDADARLTLENSSLDIDAVAEACGFDSFTLMVVGSQGPLGIHYAASRVGRVNALVVCDGMARIQGSFIESAIRTQRAIAEIEGDTGSPVAVTMFESVAPREELSAWVALDRNNSPEGLRSQGRIDAMRAWDASGELGSVQAPTLVFVSRDVPWDLIGEGRVIAAAIDGAELIALDGTFVPYATDRDGFFRALTALVPSQPIGLSDNRFMTVVFTDVVGSTEHVGQVGDSEGRTSLKAIEEVVVGTSRTHGGNVVKHMGDGSMVAFGSVSSALRFAADVQSQLEGFRLGVRMGMAAGEPIEEDGDLHGAIVAQASRIADLGGSGEVMVADAVRLLALGKGFEFESVGDVELKGFSETVAVWKLAR